jgi:3-methyl-2-oxobutanoate hydroxymethyltransferase
MKREGKKSVGVVAWDTPLAAIADRAGVDFVSVGDSVGVNLYGRTDPLDITMDEMLVVCKAVRRGVTRALVSCDFPFGPLQEGISNALDAAHRLVNDGGADMVKPDAAAAFPDAVLAIVKAEFCFRVLGTPQTAAQHGIRQPAVGARCASSGDDGKTGRAGEAGKSGAKLLDFTNSAGGGAAVERGENSGIVLGGGLARRAVARAYRD